MSCKMRGGSVASDAVNDTVPAGAFAKLDGYFTNVVGGGRKNAKGKSSNVRSGGMCIVCGGAKKEGMKHFNDFDNSGLMRVHNKRGGANSPLFDIRYDYSSAMSQPAHGPLVNRALNYEATNMMASESTTPLGDFNKLTAYGNLTDLSEGVFKYGGARRKSTSSRTSTTTKSASKRDAKPKSPAKKTTKASSKTTKATTRTSRK